MHRPMPNPPQNQAQGDLGERRHRESLASKPTRTTRTNFSILGDYILTKTLSTSSSKGKVKLATHSITGEKVRLFQPSSTTRGILRDLQCVNKKFAVKIIPRIKRSVAPNTTSKRASEDASRDIYALREAAITMLLHHPNICGMRELIVHQNHYCMVLEYIDGEDMLDHIIRHGRLRERVARKFARQIGSALEYCHRNNVVHRGAQQRLLFTSITADFRLLRSQDRKHFHLTNREH
jgi:serine/threonine protein kinase